VAELQSRSSLVVGLLAVTGAGLYALEASAAVHVDEAVTAATLLLVLGAAGAIRSVTGLVRRRERG
jgi:hypothetical protein